MASAFGGSLPCGAVPVTTHGESDGHGGFLPADRPFPVAMGECAPRHTGRSRLGGNRRG